MQMGKRAWNDIFETIKRGGFDPVEFDRDEGDEAVAIRHRQSGSELILDDGRMARYSVSWTVGDEPRKTHEVDTPSEGILLWLEELKLDLETPDLWATLRQQREMLDTSPTENTPFTADEQQEIVKELSEINVYVKQTYALPGDQMRALEGRLDYLQDAASRMGRVDWRNAATGVLLGTIVNAVLPGDAVRDALLMLFRSVGHMFGHPMPELPVGL